MLAIELGVDNRWKLATEGRWKVHSTGTGTLAQHQYQQEGDAALHWCSCEESTPELLVATLVPQLIIAADLMQSSE